MSAEAWALVDKARAGGPDAADAFADLYRLYQPIVGRFLAFRCGSRDLVDDLTSATFLKAWASISTLRWQGTDPGAWFVTIARNLLYDHAKSASHRLDRTVGHTFWTDGDANTTGIMRADDSPTPDEQIETVFLSAAVRAAIDALPPKQRLVIRLRYLADLTVAETCAHTGWNEGVVKALTYRAIRRLGRVIPRESVEAAA